MRLEGRGVLLTGATGGIGGAIARELAARGCALTLTGRRDAELVRLVTELGPPARCFAADLTNLAEVRELLDHAGPVDILVACAGLGVSQDLADTSDEALEEAIQINLLAPAALARAALAPMRQRGAGHIRLHRLGGRTCRDTGQQQHLYSDEVGATGAGIGAATRAARNGHRCLDGLSGRGARCGHVRPDRSRPAAVCRYELPAGCRSGRGSGGRARSARGSSGCRRRAAGRCAQPRRAGPSRSTRPGGRPRSDTSSGA